MLNRLEKQDFSLDIRRHFTRSGCDAYDLIHFRLPELAGEEAAPALECPDNWSDEAVSLLADQTAFTAIPARHRPVEENTVPSWLWRHAGGTKGAGRENSVRSIFNRVAGAAAYSGWKKDIFTSEDSARAFYDELRYVLAQRFIAIEPRVLATLGLDWAYGVAKPQAAEPAAHFASTEIRNGMIDALVSGNRRNASINTAWRKIAGKARPASTALRFTDIAADWGTACGHNMDVALDLMAFRHNDGSLNFETLRHAVRLAVFAFDLHEANAPVIGFTNLAPLLMALALPYDGASARALSAAITAFIGAQTVIAAAELAALRGTDAAFRDNRENTQRALRNRRRAVYGERNDYEKMSVLPAPLTLQSCPDLALAAAARAAWDEVLEAARTHGLRGLPTLSLVASPTLTLFTASAPGMEPMHSLVTLDSADPETAKRIAHPSVAEGLARLGYDRTHSKAIASIIAGAQSLAKAPGINHASLRARGFDATALQCIEDYLPRAKKLRSVFTPWILGKEFCRKTLKIPAAKLEDPRFDLLKQLGFTAEEIDAANAYCYGRDSVRGAPEIKSTHAHVFTRADEVSPETRIRMAAALQAFVSGETGLALTLSASLESEKVEKLLLAAWRQGVTSLSLAFDETIADAAKKPSKIKPSVYAKAKAPALPKRMSKSKGGTSPRRKDEASRRGWSSRQGQR